MPMDRKANAEDNSKSSRKETGKKHGRVVTRTKEEQPESGEHRQQLLAAITQPTLSAVGDARELLSLPTPPTAIFAAADIQALSVLKVARELDVKVREQLAVIGFDDIDSAEFMDLTTIRQHLDESGKLAVEILLAHIADPSRPPQHVNLPLSLVERQTT